MELLLKWVRDLVAWPVLLLLPEFEFLHIFCENVTIFFIFYHDLVELEEEKCLDYPVPESFARSLGYLVVEG
jgi:hypothetical protein